MFDTRVLSQFLPDFVRVKSNVSPRLSTSAYPREICERTTPLISIYQFSNILYFQKQISEQKASRSFLWKTHLLCTRAWSIKQPRLLLLSIFTKCFLYTYIPSENVSLLDWEMATTTSTLLLLPITTPTTTPNITQPIIVGDSPDTEILTTLTQIFCILVICFGVMGNALVLVTFVQRCSRLKSYELFIVSLCVADMLGINFLHSKYILCS